MTMTDVADAADAFDGAFRLENADTCADAAGARPRGDACGGRRGRVQLLPAAAGPEDAARGDRGPLRGGSGPGVRRRGRDRGLLRRRRVAAQRAADADRPGRPGAPDRPDLQRDGAAGAARGRRPGLHAARRCDGRWNARPRRTWRRAARGCKVLFFASPCMPVGTVFTREETAATRGGGAENDAWIVFNGHADKVAFDGRRVHARRDRASARSSSAACRRTT